MSVTIKKGLVRTGDANWVISHFDLVELDPLMWSEAMAAAIKAAKPEAIVLGYLDSIGAKVTDSDWATINANESWFVHTSGGARITHTIFNFYLMDPASSGWRSHYISQRVNPYMTASFNGLFADDVWNQVSSYLDVLSGSPTAAKIASWHNDMKGFLTYANANITSGKLVLANSDEWDTNDYIVLVDGQMLESFIHAEWTSTLSVSDGLTWVNRLVSKCGTGKIVWAHSGTAYDGTSEQRAAMLKFCYAGFLLGFNDASFWGFNSWGGDDGAKGYYSLMDTALGLATGSYYAEQNVYMRNFTGGRALFNPSANTYVINLGGVYKLLDGTPVSSVTMYAYSGEIVLNTITWAKVMGVSSLAKVSGVNIEDVESIMGV